MTTSKFFCLILVSCGLVACRPGTPTKCGYYDQGCIDRLQEVVDECNDAGWCDESLGDGGAAKKPLCEPGSGYCNPVICEVYHDYTSETAYINYCITYPGS